MQCHVVYASENWFLLLYRVSAVISILLDDVKKKKAVHKAIVIFGAGGNVMFALTSPYHNESQMHLLFFIAL